MRRRRSSISARVASTRSCARRSTTTTRTKRSTCSSTPSTRPEQAELDRDPRQVRVDHLIRDLERRAALAAQGGYTGAASPPEVVDRPADQLGAVVAGQLARKLVRGDVPAGIRRDQAYIRTLEQF